MAKRKGIPWGPGNPLYDWKQRRGKRVSRKGKSRAITVARARTRSIMVSRGARARPKMTLPLAVIVPLGSSFISPPASGWGAPLTYATAGDWAGFGSSLKYGWLGITPSGAIDFVNGANYLKWMIVGGIVHWGAGKLGINRMLGRAKVPLVRI